MVEDPEHGGERGHLWCIDPTQRGDVSPTIVYNKAAPNVPIAHKRLQACEPDKGDFERPNEKSALLWHYGGIDPKDPDQTMHRSLSSPAIKDNLLFIPDQNGLVHCVDAKTGTAHWTHDMLAVSWSTPLIAADTVCIANQEGVLFLFALSAEKKLLAELPLDGPIYNTPVVADDVLYVATFHKLYALAEGAATRPAEDESK